MNSLFHEVGNWRPNRPVAATTCSLWSGKTQDLGNFPVKFPVCRENGQSRVRTPLRRQPAESLVPQSLSTCFPSPLLFILNGVPLPVLNRCSRQRSPASERDAFGVSKPTRRTVWPRALMVSPSITWIAPVAMGSAVAVAVAIGSRSKPMARCVTACPPQSQKRAC